ncbi:hypothetical protein ADUPG1_010044, partial [Aduncisulcus paluster]
SSSSSSSSSKRKVQKSIEYFIDDDAPDDHASPLGPGTDNPRCSVLLPTKKSSKGCIVATVKSGYIVGVSGCSFEVYLDDHGESGYVPHTCVLLMDTEKDTDDFGIDDDDLSVEIELPKIGRIEPAAYPDLPGPLIGSDLPITSPMAPDLGDLPPIIPSHDVTGGGVGAIVSPSAPDFADIPAIGDPSGLAPSSGAFPIVDGPTSGVFVVDEGVDMSLFMRSRGSAETPLAPTFDDPTTSE